MTTLSAQYDLRAESPPNTDRPELCALVIEARPDTASELRSLLGATSAASVTVLRTATVAAGLDALGFGGVDVVVLGAEVPLDAATIAPLLRGAGDAIPIVALTDSADPHDTARVMATGVHDCVPVAGITPDGLGWPALRAVQRVRAATWRTPNAAVPANRRASSPPVVSPQAMQTATPAVAALVGLLELLTTAWEVLGDDQRLGLLATIRSCAATVELLTSAATSPGDALGAPQLIALAPAVVAAARGVHDVELNMEIADHTAVWIDPLHLQEILTGLLTHALAGTAPPLTVTATHRGATVRVSIMGSGAEPPVAARGFSLLHATSAAFDDNDGAGLESARRFAERSGGIAGVDEYRGSVWARLPNLPQNPDFA